MPSTTIRTLVFLTAFAAPLSAQRTVTPFDDDTDWLENCRRGGNSDERGRACEVREVGMKPGGKFLEVDGRSNGSIRVIAWDRPDVHVTARLQASARSDEDARATLKDISVKTDDRRIASDGPRMGDREYWSVSYVINVPRSFDLRLDSNNGSLGVAGVSGKLDLSTTNGSLTLTDVSGDVRARTQNGSVNVQLSGSQWDGAGLDAETQNGSVRMSIPEKYAARIETRTVNGHLNSDFPITVQGRIGRELNFPLNGGGRTLRATTVNGSVTLLRR